MNINKLKNYLLTTIIGIIAMIGSIILVSIFIKDEDLVCLVKWIIGIVGVCLLGVHFWVDSDFLPSKLKYILPICLTFITFYIVSFLIVGFNLILFSIITGTFLLVFLFYKLYTFDLEDAIKNRNNRKKHKVYVLERDDSRN